MRRASKISTPAGNYGNRSKPQDPEIANLIAEINSIDEEIIASGEDPDTDDIDKILQLQSTLRQKQKEASLSH